MNAQVAPVKKTSEMSAKEKAEYITKHGGTKSGAIRALTNEGKTRMEVSKLLGIRYQHVRNVLITPIKTPANKVAAS
jgi:hypothetical protein